MSRAHRGRTGLATVAGAVLGCLVIAGTASAAYWDPAILLRTGPNLEMEDIAAGGTSAAVGWSESSGPRELWARTSDTSGSAFDPRFRLAVDPSKSGHDLALDVGAGSVWAGWPRTGGTERTPTAGG